MIELELAIIVARELLWQLLGSPLLYGLLCLAAEGGLMLALVAVVEGKP